MFAEDLTVVVTTIPTRRERLQIALKSIGRQFLLPGSVIIQCDAERIGAPANRDAGLARVTTPYVAFLDDDDYFYSQHLQTLYRAAQSHDADLVYSWFDVEGGTDPFPHYFGKPWDPLNPVQTTVTTLGRTEAYREVGGFSGNKDVETDNPAVELARNNRAGEDFFLVAKLNHAGKKIVHVPERTWAYVHWGQNTSGLPDRW